MVASHRLEEATFPYVRHRWPAVPEAAAQVRSSLRGWLRSVRLDPVVEQDVVVAAHEAVINAVEHAYVDRPGRGDVEVVFWSEDRHVYVQVSDDGEWREPDDDADRERGHGITMMSRLTEGVLIRKCRPGTQVLLCYALPHPPAQRDRPAHLAPA